MENKKIVGYDFNGRSFNSIEKIFEWVQTHEFILEETEEKIYPTFLTPIEIEARRLIDYFIDGYGYVIDETDITTDVAMKELQEMIDVWTKKYGQRCVFTLDLVNAFDFPMVDYIKWKDKKNIKTFED